MDRKLKKDFRERHKASLEREMLKTETSSIPEESKLKHSDDYREKIVHDKERFQDKVHEKISKVSSDNEKIEGTSKDRKSTRLNSSHANISYAVFCLKKKKKKYTLHILIDSIIKK